MEKWLSRLVNLNWATTVMSLVCGVGIWLAFRKILPPQIPLLYSKPWGENQLVKPDMVLLIPCMTCVIGIVLGLIALKEQKEEYLLKFILISVSIVSQVILTVGLIRIMWLVL